MTFRLYRTPRIGDGIRPPDGQGAFRSKLSDYKDQMTALNPEAGYKSPICDHAPVRYALAWCDPSVHAIIEADPEITPLSPEFPTLLALGAWLDEPLSGIPPAIQSLFEADGFSVAWATAGTTKRQMLRYLLRHHTIGQDMRGAQREKALAFVANHLDTAVRDIAPDIRDDIAAWLTSKGLDTSLIKPNTTVRQIVQYLLENADWQPAPFGSWLTF